MDRIEQILTGEQRGRSNSDARAGIPMNGPEVRDVISKRIAATGDKTSCKAIAKLALKIGNLSPCGRQVYQEYIAAVDSLGPLTKAGQ
jgi:hypothetical protein